MMIATHCGTDRENTALIEQLMNANEELQQDKSSLIDQIDELSIAKTPQIKRESDVIRWAEDKGIFSKATPASQHSKTLEEVQELTDALAVNDHVEIQDAIGDIIVTLIIQAQMNGLTAGECLDSAYEVIKGRTGQMIDGVFVKDVA